MRLPLATWGSRPLIDLGLRLGEGTGARPRASARTERGARAAGRGHVRLGRGHRQELTAPVTELRDGLPPYLLGLRLGGRPVVVVGGGAVAARRVPALLEAGAEYAWSPRGHRLAGGPGRGRADPLGSAGIRTRRLRRRLAGLRVHGRPAANAGRRRGGRSAADLVRARRRRRGLGRLDSRRRARRATSGSACSAATRGAARRSGTRCSAACGRASSVPGTTAAAAPGVAIIGGGPGDPGLITVRGRQLLAEADVVLTDRLAPRVAARRAARRRRDHRREQDSLRPGHGPGADQRGADQPRPGGPVRGPAQGRRPVRVRPGRRGGAGLPAGGRSRHRRARRHQRGRGARQRLGAGHPPGRGPGFSRRLRPRSAR